MECRQAAVSFLSWALISGALTILLFLNRNNTKYGRYGPEMGPHCPARVAWFLQEVPSLLLPLLLLLLTEEPHLQPGRSKTLKTLLLCSFMLHYFHRSFFYSSLTRGRPVPLRIFIFSTIFCSLNGFLQGHHLLHCVQFEDTWLTDARMAAGFILFVVGMIINIHSDSILRSLRKPGEVVYRIPYGGMFEFVSGANYFGEIVEWWGYALATWSLPSFAFAFFTACTIGLRAFHHHRDYQQRFEDYPRTRKAVIPFIL